MLATIVATNKTMIRILLLLVGAAGITVRLGPTTATIPSMEKSNTDAPTHNCAYCDFNALLIGLLASRLVDLPSVLWLYCDCNALFVELLTWRLEGLLAVLWRGAGCLSVVAAGIWGGEGMPNNLT